MPKAPKNQSGKESYSDRNGKPVFDSKDIPSVEGGSAQVSRMIQNIPDKDIDKLTQQYVGNSNDKWNKLMRRGKFERSIEGT